MDAAVRIWSTIEGRRVEESRPARSIVGMTTEVVVSAVEEGGLRSERVSGGWMKMRGI